MPYFLGTRAARSRNSAVSHRTLKERAYFLRGFTLIELVVVTAIISVITGLILVSDAAFGGKILLENLAYDMALSIRQAQVYGISVQKFSTNVFNAGYGIHLDTTSSGNQITYLMFADAVTVNGLYDCPNPTPPVNPATCELVQSTGIERGFRVSKLCSPAGTDSMTCTAVNKMDILFVRPNPDALISVDSGSGMVSCPLSSNPAADCKTSARIVLKSPRGDLTSIVVDQNGQIAVSKQ